MIKVYFILLLLCCGTRGGAAPLTLEEAYRATMEKTESVPFAESQFRATQARVEQARSGFLPELSANANHARQETVISSTGKRDQTLTRLTVAQSLFAGGKDAAILSAAKSDRLAGEYTIAATKNTLYAAVARAYYALLAAQKEVENTKLSIDLTQKRIDELQKRQKIGKSRNIEVLAAQAQRSVLEAQLLAAVGEQRIAKNNFSNATGLDRDSALDDSAALPAEIDRARSFLEFIDRRPDVLALQATREGADSLVRSSFAGHLPKLDLSGNYYLSRSKPQAGPDWDALLVLTVPIFSGGITQGQVHEAREREMQAELQLLERKRDAENEIRTAQNRLSSALEQVKSLEKALSATEQNYREQEKDYRYSLATNLDVLQAITTYQETKRTLDKTRYEALSSLAELKAATNQVEL